MPMRENATVVALGTEMVTVSEAAATVAQRVSSMDRWLPAHKTFWRTR